MCFFLSLPSCRYLLCICPFSCVSCSSIQFYWLSLSFRFLFVVVARHIFREVLSSQASAFADLASLHCRAASLTSAPFFSLPSRGTYFTSAVVEFFFWRKPAVFIIVFLFFEKGSKKKKHFLGITPFLHLHFSQLHQVLLLLLFSSHLCMLADLKSYSLPPFLPFFFCVCVCRLLERVSTSFVPLSTYFTYIYIYIYLLPGAKRLLPLLHSRVPVAGGFFFVLLLLLLSVLFFRRCQQVQLW